MTTTTRTEKTPQTLPNPEFLTGMWDAALKTQKQWFGLFTQPFGFVPPEKLWTRWQLLNTECLDHTEKTFTHVKDYITDEVEMVRKFTDKTLKLTKDFDKETVPPIKPEFTREWFDTTWRCFERTIDFNKQAMKDVEALGFKVSEMLMKEPTTTKAG